MPQDIPYSLPIRVCVLVVSIASLAVACVGQQMNLGPHDIGGRGCVVCHVPTRDSRAQVQSTWAVTPTRVSIKLPSDEGWSHSARCLSCHEDTHVQVMDPDGIGSQSLPKASGPHPVNVRYTPKDQSLFPVRQIGGEWRLVNNPENPSTNLRLFRRSAADPTPTVQCTSCHDPHDYRNPFFLRDPYDRYARGTRFCRTCHAEQSNYPAGLLAKMPR